MDHLAKIHSRSQLLRVSSAAVQDSEAVSHSWRRHPYGRPKGYPATRLGDVKIAIEHGVIVNLPTKHGDFP